MTTNTTTTDLKTFPEERHHVPTPGAAPPSGGKGKKRGLIWVLFLVVIAGVTGYAVWRAGQPGLIPQTNQGRGRGGGRGNPNGGPLPVVAAAAKKQPVPVYIDGLGNVIAYYTDTIQSRVTGQLMKVDFQEGDFVTEGQTLLEIDPRPYQAVLDQAVGQLARDQALLADAKIDLDRYKTLLTQDAIPKQQLDTQTYLVAQYEGTVKLDQANVEAAQLNVTYSKITAPISGVVGLRLVDPGNIVTANTGGMITITQLQPIAVDFTIPEDRLPEVIKKLRAPGGAKLPVDAYNRDNSVKLASGTLLTMDNQINNTTGTSQLKAIFDNKDFALFPQQFVNIRLLVDTLQNQTVIPTVAVQNGQVSPINPTGTFVYVIDDKNIAHLRPVTLFSSDQSGADIKSGIEVGERVAVDGADRLQDGAPVRIRDVGEVERQAAEDAAALAARRGRGRGRGAAGPNGGPGGGQEGQFKKGGGQFKKGGGGPR